MRDALLATAEFGRRDDEQREWVLPLHGGLPPDEQRRVFDRPPPRRRAGGLDALELRHGGGGGAPFSADGHVVKVVLATNVAETSITIDDVGFVIDAGRVKEERYEVARRMASLQDVLISAAAAKQRRGRAGRVQHGLCAHLFTSDTELAPYTQPEVCRVALEQLVMRTKSLRLPGRAADSIGRLPDPPSLEAVAAAVAELSSLGALDSDEKLTPMGQVRSTPPLPSPPHPSRPHRPGHSRAPHSPGHSLHSSPLASLLSLASPFGTASAAALEASDRRAPRQADPTWRVLRRDGRGAHDRSSLGQPLSLSVSNG